MEHEERAAGKRNNNGTTVSYYDLEQAHCTRGVSQSYQVTNFTAPAVPVESTCHDYEKPHSKATRKRCLFDVDFEELPGSAGRYACPYANCIFSNYVFGFETRTDRNKHMGECPYGDGKVHPYIASDSQLPSTQLITNLVDAFPGDANLKIMFERLFLKSPGLSISAFSSAPIPPTTRIEEPNKLPSGDKKNCCLGDEYDHFWSTRALKGATSCGESSSAILLDEKYPNNKSSNSAIETFDGVLPNNSKDYPTSNLAVSPYKDAGQPMLENCSSRSVDVVAFEHKGTVSVSSDRRKGLNGTEGEKVCEAVNNNINPLIFKDDESAQLGFQLAAIDEFLDEKSYLLDDDICLG